MRKHLLNLERLCVKLQALYGENDPLVQQLHCEWNEKRKTHERVAQSHAALPFREQGSAFTAFARRARG